MKSTFNILIFFVLAIFIPIVKGQVTSLALDENISVSLRMQRLLDEGNEKVLFQVVDSILQHSEDVVENGCAYYYKGLAITEYQQFDLALLSFTKAIDLFESKSYFFGLALAHKAKGDLFSKQEKYSDAIQHYNRAISFSESLHLKYILIDLFQKKAQIYFLSQESDSSFYFLKSALQYARSVEDKELCITIINQLSTNYHSQGELDSAINYFKENLKLKQKINDPAGLISDLSALGNLYRERGKYEFAQEYLLDALTMAESESDYYSMTTIYSELGGIYAEQSIWNVSEDYYKKAINLAKEIKSKFMEAGCLKKLGFVFEQQGNIDKSIEYYEEALGLYSALKNRINTAAVMISLSNIYKKKDQFDKIREMLLEALQTNNMSDDLITTLNIKMALAEIEIKRNNPSKGIVYALECREAYKEMNDKKGLRDVSLLLSTGYAKKGVFKNAYNYHLEYNGLKDSLVNVERAEAIKKYALLVTTQRKDAEISNKDKMLHKQELSLLKKNNQLLMLGGGLGLIALLFVLILFVFYKNKQLNMQKIQVLEKEQEADRLKAIIEGEEKERKRFARELHDGLGAVLATVKMQISSIVHNFPNVEQSANYLKAEQLIDDACRTIRDISHDLMPHVLEQQGLLAAIKDMCQNLSVHNDITFDFICFGSEDGIEDVQKIALFRITQELLKNIIKHAEASEVIVQLTFEDDEIILIVEDDGKGFDSNLNSKGIGIKNVISRTEYLEGQLEIDSIIGKGSTFTVHLPIKK